MEAGRDLLRFPGPSPLCREGSAKADCSVLCSLVFWTSLRKDKPWHLCTSCSSDRSLRIHFPYTWPEFAFFQLMFHSSFPITVYLWEASDSLFSTNLQLGSCSWPSLPPSPGCICESWISPAPRCYMLQPPMIWTCSSMPVSVGNPKSRDRYPGESQESWLERKHHFLIVCCWPAFMTQFYHATKILQTIFLLLSENKLSFFSFPKKENGRKTSHNQKIFQHV